MYSDSSQSGTVSLGKDRNVTIQKFEACGKDSNFWKGGDVSQVVHLSDTA